MLRGAEQEGALIEKGEFSYHASKCMLLYIWYCKEKNSTTKKFIIYALRHDTFVYYFYSLCFLYAQTNFMFQYRIFLNLQKQNNPQSKIWSLNYLSNNDILINVKQCFK